jgi:hypothetical protein
MGGQSTIDSNKPQNKPDAPKENPGNREARVAFLRSSRFPILFGLFRLGGNE